MSIPHGARTALRAIPLAVGTLLAACAHAPLRPQPPATPAAPATPEAAGVVPRAEPRSASGNPPFYVVNGHRYIVLATAAGYRERGVASWYGPDFNGLKTATGERYDMFAMTAAHKTLPIPCYARVTNLANGRSVVVRINDRGPFVANRIIDLSYSAASRLDMVRNGTAFVEVETLTPTSPQAVTGAGTALPVVTPAASAASAGGPGGVPAVTGPLPPPPVAATPAPAPAGEPPGTVDVTGHFYIQVGAYGLADNARRAAAKLRAAGLHNVLMLAPTAGQPLQRVRVGPIGSVQEFDQLIARLNALGFHEARLAQD